MKRFLLILGFVLSLSFVVGCCIHSHKLSQPEEFDLISHINKSTIALIHPNHNSYCSGVWISEMHIMTARHCVSDSFPTEVELGTMFRYHTIDSYDFHTPSRRVDRTYGAKVIAISTTSDLAVLKSVDEISHNIALIGTYKKIPQGLDVHISGHPLNHKFTYMTGKVAAVRTHNNFLLFPNEQKIIHIVSHVAPGSSGGGAFDNQGRLIGICSFFNRDMDGHNFFMHQDKIIEFLDEEEINYYTH